MTKFNPGDRVRLRPEWRDDFPDIGTRTGTIDHADAAASVQFNRMDITVHLLVDRLELV